MNFSELYDLVQQKCEYRVIGREYAAQSSHVSLAGVYRFDGTDRLVALTWDEEYAEKREEWDIAEINGVIPPEDTPPEPYLPFEGLESMTIGGIACRIDSGSRQQPTSFEAQLLLFELIKSGFTPPDWLKYRDLDNVWMEVFHFAETLSQSVDLRKAPLTLRCRPGIKTFPCSMELTLPVNGAALQKFVLAANGQKIPFWIDAVSLYHPEKELVGALMQYQNDLAPDRFQQRYKDYLRIARRLAPGDSRLPIVEYEAPKGIALSMRLASLPYRPASAPAAADEADSNDAAACIGIIGGADGPTAVFLAAKPEDRTAHEGFCRRAEVINETVRCDTQELKVVIHSYDVQQPPVIARLEGIDEIG